MQWKQGFTVQLTTNHLLQIHNFIASYFYSVLVVAKHVLYECAISFNASINSWKFFWYNFQLLNWILLKVLLIPNQPTNLSIQLHAFAPLHGTQCSVFDANAEVSWRSKSLYSHKIVVNISSLYTPHTCPCGRVVNALGRHVQ